MRGFKVTTEDCGYDRVNYVGQNEVLFHLSNENLKSLEVVQLSEYEVEYEVTVRARTTVLATNPDEAVEIADDIDMKDERFHHDWSRAIFGDAIVKNIG